MYFQLCGLDFGSMGCVHGRGVGGEPNAHAQRKLA